MSIINIRGFTVVSKLTFNPFDYSQVNRHFTWVSTLGTTNTGIGIVGSAGFSGRLTLRARGSNGNLLSETLLNATSGTQDINCAFSYDKLNQKIYVAINGVGHTFDYTEDDLDDDLTTLFGGTIVGTPIRDFGITRRADMLVPLITQQSELEALTTL